MDSFKQGGWFVWANCNTVSQYVQFIHRFEMGAGATAVRLNISADSEYAAWINGKLAAFGQYADYPAYKVYDGVDISALLQPGNNTLCILGYCQNEDSSVYRKGEPGVWFQVTSGGTVLACSGTDTICRVAADYQSGPMARVTPQLSFTFRYDANWDDGWHSEAYSPDESWSFAAVRENASVLHPRPIRKLALHPRRTAVMCAQGIFKDAAPAPENVGERMQSAFLSGREFSSMAGFSASPLLPADGGIRISAGGGDGIYIVIDLGGEEAGLLELEWQAAAGDVIDIGYGEHLEDLRVRASVGGRTFAARYVCREGRQSFTHYIHRVGCRYIQLHVYSDEFTLFYAGLRPTPYPVERRGSFHCSDTLHNRIFETSVRTLHLCMHEHYEDCPWREQALYSMDSRNQMLFGYYAFGEYEFAKAGVRLMALSLRDDGLLELCSPAKIIVTIPSFSLTWIIQLYEYVLFSGDKAFGREMYDTARTIMRAFTGRIDETGLLPHFQAVPYWNFYEWADGLDGGAIVRETELPSVYDAPLNAFCSLALNAIAGLAEWLGAADEASAYRSMQVGLNDSIAGRFWDEGRRLFASSWSGGLPSHFAELTQSLIVCCGACPDDKRETVLTALASGEHSLVPVTLSSTIFKYEALLSIPEKFGHWVLDDIGRVWGGMLFQGATSFWETAKGAADFDNAGSLCHGWSAVPVYIYYAYVLGMTPVSPGFAEYASRPVATPIVKARGVVPAAGGAYEVAISNDLDTVIAHVK